MMRKEEEEEEDKSEIEQHEGLPPIPEDSEEQSEEDDAGDAKNSKQLLIDVKPKRNILLTPKVYNSSVESDGMNLQPNDAAKKQGSLGAGTAEQTMIWTGDFKEGMLTEMQNKNDLALQTSEQLQQDQLQEDSYQEKLYLERR